MIAAVLGFLFISSISCHCEWFGRDMSQLHEIVFTSTDSFSYVINFCSPSPRCGNNMACQYSSSTNQSYVLIRNEQELSIDPSSPKDSLIATSGEPCGTSPRISKIKFLCESTSPSVTESPDCTYNFVIHDESFCYEPITPTYRPTPRPSPSRSFNLSPLILGIIACTSIVVIILYRCRQRALHQLRTTHPTHTVNPTQTAPPPTTTVPPTSDTYELRSLPYDPTSLNQYTPVPIYIQTNAVPMNTPGATGVPYIMTVAPNMTTAPHSTAQGGGFMYLPPQPYFINTIPQK